MFAFNTSWITTRFAVLGLASTILLSGPVTAQIGLAPPIRLQAGKSPTAVVTGDFNQDGRLDYAAANLASGNVSVFLNQGNTLPPSVQSYRVGRVPVSIAAGDINSDGFLDLVVANATSGNISILTNQGNGTFGAAQNLTTGATCYAVTVGDVDQDGDVDIVTANLGANQVSLLVNKGQGTFKRVKNLNVGKRPIAVALGDLNRDGRPEIVTANSTDSSISVLLNQGGANFAAALRVPTQNSPQGVVVGDFDQDGDGDLATTNYLGVPFFGSSAVTVIKNLGGGSFSPPQTYPVGPFAAGITTGDLDNDGDLEIVTANQGYTFTDVGAVYPATVSVLRNRGDGTFTQSLLPTVTAFYASSHGVALGDVDGDGDLDVLTADRGYYVYFTSPGKVSILSNTTPFLTSVTPSQGQAGTLVTLAGRQLAQVKTVSFNGTPASFTQISDSQVTTVVPVGATTGLLTIVTNEGSNNAPTFFTVPGTPAILSVSPSSGYVGTTVVLQGQNFLSTSSVLFNGTPTVFTINSASQITATVPVGATTGTITLTTPLGSNRSSYDFVILVPFIQRLNPTIGLPGSTVLISGGNFVDVTQVSFNGTPALFTVNSPTQITATVPVSATSGLVRVTTLSGQGSSPTPFTVIVAPQIISFSPTSGTSSASVVLTGSGFSGTTAVTFNGTPATFTVNSATQITTTVPAGASTGQITVTNPAGSASSTQAFTVITQLSFLGQNYASPAYPNAIAQGDLDGDGDLDLVTCNSGFYVSPNNISVFFNQGNGIFSTPQNFAVGNSPQDVQLADLDGDGDLDAVTANAGANTVSVLFNTGQGSFGPALTVAAGPFPRQVVAADWDRDGDLDLGVANSPASGVSLLFNNGNGSFGAVRTVLTPVNPAVITAGDLDGDGDVDLVTGNLSNNTLAVFKNNGNGTFSTPQNFAVGQYPAAVVAADLDLDGDLDLVSANSKGLGSITVLLNQGTGSFGAGVDYGVSFSPAALTAADFNKDGKPDLAVANEGNSGQVTIFLGVGNGSFFSPQNFSIGVFSRPSGIVAGDFNADGRVDLATADNKASFLTVLTNTTP